MMEARESSKEEVLAAIRERCYQFKYELEVPESLKADRDIVLAALEHVRCGITIVPTAFHTDREVMFACAKYGLDLGSLPDSWKDDAEFVAQLLHDSGGHFQHASPRVRSLRDVALLAVADTSYNNLAYVQPPLFRDREVLKTALRAHIQAYLHVPEDLRADPELLALAIENSGGNCVVFEKMPAFARDDRAIALKMVSRDGLGFRYASEQLRDDKEVLLTALAKDMRVLDDASARLRADVDVVRFVASSKDCRYGFRHLDPAARNIPDVVTLALQSGVDLKDLSDNWRDDEGTVRAAVGNRGENYQAASARLKAVRDIALLAAQDHVRGISFGGFDLSWAPDNLRADSEIVRHAIRSEARNISHVPSVLTRDDAFLRELAVLNDGILQHLPEDVKARLFLTSVESVEHRGRKVVYQMVLDEGCVHNCQRTAQKAMVMAAGMPLVSMAGLPVLTYEEDGPARSYLSVRYCNNLLLAGDFVFFVQLNSGNVGVDFRNEANSWTNDEFLRHQVYLVPVEIGDLDYATLSACPRIYFGRHALFPKGIQLFPKENSYREAVTVLKQEAVYGDPLFTRIDNSTLQAAGVAVEEVAGAARVYVDGYGWRFLIPHAEGAIRALEVLKATQDHDDWLWIQMHAGALSLVQKLMLVSHFATTEVADEVSAFCS